MTWTAKAATVGAQRVHYLDAGNARSPHVLLLVHAFPVGMRMWEPVTVPDGWRALAPALPGFDGTEPPPHDSTSIDDYARFVLAFLDHLGLDSAVLGGLSMGGYTAFALWRLARLRWRGLVLADTRATPDTVQGRATREKLLEVLRARGAHGIAEEMVPKLLGRTTRERQPRIVDHVRRLVERQTNEGIAAAVVRLRDRPDSTSLLSEIGVPTLVIVGEEDEVTPLGDAETMKTRLEDARLARVPEAGHLSCIENPAGFNAALAGYLNEIRG
jgi:pimeloyl-ACP methyl ester carboxylesterase